MELQHQQDSVRLSTPPQELQATPPTTAASVAPSEGGVPPSVAALKDERAIQYYKMQSLVIAKIEERAAAGQTLGAADLDTLAISKAVKSCIEQHRFWYLGHKANTPPYSHLQSATTRYIATVLGDTSMVFEMMDVEYPDVFKNDPRQVRR